MPKVVHVVRKFEPEQWGGTETHLVALIRELDALGWSSEVHAPAESGTDGTPITDLGATFRSFRACYPYLRMGPERRAALVAAGGNLVSFPELGKLLLATKMDMLHVHTLGRLGGVVRTAARLRRLPYAVTLHGPVRAYAQVAEQDAERRTDGLIDLGAPFGALVGARRVVHDANLAFVLNNKEYAAWESDRHGKHLEIISHGVDPERATPRARRDARARIGGLGDAPFVVIVARIDRAKGQDLALRAFVRAAPPSWHLVLVGSVSDEAYNQQLEELARGTDGRVHLVGGVPPSVARAMLAEAELAMVPSRSEPFGIVLLEAWAEATPAIFSSVGGMADIAKRTGASFGLVPPDDEEALTEALREAIADEPGRAVEARAAAARVAKHYSWRALALQIVKRYQGVLRMIP